MRFIQEGNKIRTSQPYEYDLTIFIILNILVDFLPFFGVRGSKKEIHYWLMLETIILCMALMEEHGSLEDESVVEIYH